jgi:hypothetical protein
MQKPSEFDVMSLGIGRTLYQVSILVYFLIQMGESTLH